MLFEIQEDVAELFENGAPTQQDRDGLANLLLGSIEGNHRLGGSRKCLTRISRIASLSDKEKRCVERLLLRYSEEASVIHRLQTIGKVEISGGNTPHAHIIGGRRFIHFPLTWFDSTARIQPVTLLGENLLDSKIFERVGEVGLILDGLRYLPLRSCKDSGGGGTTRLVLSHHAAQETICICLVDSDRLSPAGQLGSTATSVSQFKDETRYPTIHVLETSSRDLENILPDVFYLGRYGNHATYGALADFIQKLSASAENEVRFHLDIEKGLKLFDFKNNNANPIDLHFWQHKEATLLPLAGSSSLPCLARAQCPQGTKSLCTCEVVRGIGTNVLHDYLAFVEGKNAYICLQELTDSVKPEWRRLGIEVAAWCCSDDRVRM